MLSTVGKITGTGKKPKPFFRRYTDENSGARRNHSDTLNCMQIFEDLLLLLRKQGSGDARRIASFLEVLKDQERTIVDEDGVILSQKPWMRKQ